METHHHHNTAASRTQQQQQQQQQPGLPTVQSSSSSLSSTSPHLNPAPSIGAVPTTTAGPITISIVVALTLVICLILNCGKLKRRVSPQRYNVQQQPDQPDSSIAEKPFTTKSMRPSMAVKSPSSRNDSSPWSSSSTLLSPQAAPTHTPRQLHDDPSNNLMQNHYQPPSQPPISRIQPLSHNSPP